MSEFEELRQALSEGQKLDGTAPLYFEAGYRHVTCGGAAEVAKPPYHMADCASCGHIVPREEVVTEAAWKAMKLSNAGDMA